MPAETGVVGNIGPIDPRLPNLGQWFGDAGYESVYCGKWHIPFVFQMNIPGFTVLPVGLQQGDMSDSVVSRSCEAFLTDRHSDKPFLLIASFTQPFKKKHNPALSIARSLYAGSFWACWNSGIA